MNQELENRPRGGLRRRDWLAGLGGLPLGAGLLGAAASSPAQAQPRTSRPLRVAQLLDVSTEQQELSRDYSTGLRIAVAELNRGGRPWQLISIECDGSKPSLDAAVQRLREDGSIAMLIGTAGERLALESAAALRRDGVAIAQVGPWASDTRAEDDPAVLPLFASREDQLRRAMQDLGSMGVLDIGVVYSSARERQALAPGVELLGTRLKLRTRSFVAPAGADFAAWGAKIAGDSPVVMLFLGGSPELARLTQGIASAGRQRYVVSLADVDLPTLMQLSPARSVPLILTQVVPNPQTSVHPAVRSYRALLKELYEEAPSHLSLAGYLAGRYAAQVVGRFDAAPPSRAELLAAFQRRPGADVGGFQVSFANEARRGSSFVSQTMLTADGRLLG
ncbi:ABC transporter substrate-binding protein [Rivibacter subsaxonicus]|uniref:Amino acid/amide ABC transporter substrate-binding protein (HAAT family) n=1 Tax=Rivibacter subsaxonicus TaxID=457575 RepID=A0A4Q7VNT9_9BURK|nr:ABC transporter substrate-binding protein [Rivibacter subsaxonicus]RZT98043.1 amino acid/amide ABC transporter substrate-binding protein (HAAT family) [Rivibacter subsaxonicus]